ncbi:MAG: bifunctional adenosylcobinamide kinase/adenosylcobinamide-phosphate guanylyltransferase [Butyricicoccus pullicaecorum]|nr:bifunctional adenosylcobinamide kinase/adenosylcobinamide-phosphate guanylyltransferase [Butyricicoccus pullicaecorum]MDO4668616.1 bifunctional adenosylcobinamide kinase/adenosylcobinamide-phosphate guanylyltransferase [Butyricicoccus pullicaecorum]
MNCLIVGGAYQGKRTFAQKEFELLPEEIADGAQISLGEPLRKRAVCNVQHLVRRALAEQIAVPALLELLDGKIVLCDEIGCGVVPAEREPDLWREAVGRLCCDLAARADVVYWVRAGIAQKIKGV